MIRPRPKTQDSMLRIVSHYFFLLAILAFISRFSYNFFGSTLPLYVESIHFSALYTGTLLMVFSLGSAIFRLSGGMIIDCRGRRITIITGFSLYAFGLIGMGFSRIDWVTFLACFATGSGFGLAGVGVTVAIADVVPIQHLEEGIGYQWVAQSFADAIGPTIGLMVFASFGFQTTIGAAGSFLLVAILLGFVYKYEQTEEYQAKMADKTSAPTKSDPVQSQLIRTYPHVWKFIDKRAIPVSLIYFFFGLAHASILTFITLYAQNHKIPNAGFFFTIYAVGTIAVRFFVSKISNRPSPIKTIILGIILLIISVAMLLSASRIMLIYYCAGLFYGFSCGMTIPALIAATIRNIPIERRGAATGTYNLFGETAYMFTSVMGLIIDHAGFQAMFLLCILFLLFAICLTFLFSKCLAEE